MGCCAMNGWDGWWLQCSISGKFEGTQWGIDEQVQYLTRNPGEGNDHDRFEAVRMFNFEDG